MSGKVAHQLTDQGVLVVLRPGIGAPSSLRITEDEAKRFAWALLSDVDPDGQASPGEPAIVVGPIRIDTAAMTVSVGETFVHFTRCEMKALDCLARHRDQCVTKERIFDWLYGDDDDAPTLKIVDVFICKLRKKLAYAGHPGLIETAWGSGYRLLAEPRGLIGPSFGTGGRVTGDEGRPRRLMHRIQGAVLQRLNTAPATFGELCDLDPEWSPASLRGVVYRLLQQGKARNIGGRKSAVYTTVAA